MEDTIKTWVKCGFESLIWHKCPYCGKQALQQQTIFMTPVEVLTPFCPFCGKRIKQGKE